MFETHRRYGFHIGHFDRNEISFRVIKYHVNTTRNEMPTYVHQNIGSFWNAAEMKLHVNRTCFHAGLKSQTGMSSFRLSCERTLRIWELLTFYPKVKKYDPINVSKQLRIFFVFFSSKNRVKGGRGWRYKVLGFECGMEQNGRGGGSCGSKF